MPRIGYVVRQKAPHDNARVGKAHTDISKGGGIIRDNRRSGTRTRGSEYAQRTELHKRTGTTRRTVGKDDARRRTPTSNKHPSFCAIPSFRFFSRLPACCPEKVLHTDGSC